MRKITALILCMVFVSLIYMATPVAAETANNNIVQVRDFIVPDNTLLEVRLNQRLRAERIGNGTRFTMNVINPNQFRGAVIEGYVMDASRSGRMTGRSEITLNFDRIRMRNGRIYNFAGTIEDVRTTGGERVSVDREGSVREDSQTDRTVGRTAVGAVVGTIIGAVAGGGSGAAKGAVLGGGIGAGSVLVQGRNNLDLRNGTRMTIRASAPR
jgi:hypothetical protein